MRKFSLMIVLLVGFTGFSQEEFIVDGQPYQLKTEVDGSWDLLWNVINDQYRYFIKTDNGDIQELTNTKNSTGNYQNEYKIVLNNLSGNTLDTSKLKLTLGSLKQFFNLYNAKNDSDYVLEEPVKIKSRMGFFGGMTNNPFVDNPDSKFTGLLGTELELYDDKKAKRHAAFLQLTHVFETKDLEFSTTEIALGYRFRFLYSKTFNIHANVKLVTINFTKSKYATGEGATFEINKKSETAFDAPLTFGVGADYKISDNGFITFYYNEIVSVSFNNQGNFPMNFALGYKFNL